MVTTLRYDLTILFFQQLLSLPEVTVKTFRPTVWGGLGRPGRRHAVYHS